MRRKFSWTEFQFDKLNKVIEITEELKEYMPLTLRQIYYQLVGKGYIENKVSEYTMLSKLFKHARLDGYISWDDIEDRVRVFHDLRGFSNKDSFISQELKNFLYGYSRNLLQSQDKCIEIWIEKDALSSVFTKVTRQYSIPVVVCRGFSSISFLNDFRNRTDYYKSLHKDVVMLYFGDFDPSGVEMLSSMEITLKEELHVDNIEFKRIALLKQDIFDYRLPNNPNALKKTDTRAIKHIKAFGELAVELDALRPDILEQKIKSAIKNELDIEAFNEQVNIHNSEFDKLNELRKDVKQYMSRLI